MYFFVFRRYSICASGGSGARKWKDTMNTLIVFIQCSQRKMIIFCCGHFFCLYFGSNGHVFFLLTVQKIWGKNGTAGKSESISEGSTENQSRNLQGPHCPVMFHPGRRLQGSSLRVIFFYLRLSFIGFRTQMEKSAPGVEFVDVIYSFFCEKLDV